jgi:5-methylthioadenosine/S-adenosylhomocysteine deaminase
MTMFRNYADDMKLMDWLFKKIFPLEDKLDEDISYWGANLAILEMIKGGTTTFCDMYYFMTHTAKAVLESGMRAALTRGLVGETADDNDIRMKENLDLYREYNNGGDGRIKVMLGPHAIYTCSVPYLENVVKVSKEYNMPIHVHLSETREEVKNCMDKHGVSPVKLLDGIGMLSEDTVAAHCVVVDDEDIDILSRRRVNVSHNPNSNMKLASGIAPIRSMLEKGINVCLGTDGAASNNNLDMLEEMRAVSYLQKVYCDDPTVLPVDQCLKMATVNGARALGFSNLGGIEKGNIADIIVINTEKPYYYPKYNVKSAIVYSGNSADVETVIIDGRIVMENGKLLTMDEERVYYEVERCAKKITS